MAGVAMVTRLKYSPRYATINALLLASFFLAFAGCQLQSSGDPGPEIVVAAAANLTEAAGEIGQRFTNKTGIRVIFTFGATTDLAKQIENGAPFDVYVAADVTNVDRLERQGLLTADTRSVYARGRLVMWIAPGNNFRAQHIQDITAKEFERIAIAKPDIAPYGQATVESLRALGLWEQIEPKVIYAQNVAQAKQFAATGNAEVAFLPLALVKTGEGEYLEIDQNLHRPIDQALAIVKASSHQQEARQFSDFLLSEEGQTILEARGYRRPQ
jgi:molybdate transport system substrate-binding protein